MEILKNAHDLIGTPIEGYKKDDTPAKCAERFATLVKKCGKTWQPRKRAMPAFVGKSYSFKINGGTVWVDHTACDAQTAAFVVAQSSGLLKEEKGKPVLALSAEDVAGKDSELIALEIECRRAGKNVVFVDLPVPGID